jgi:hypothetical protein
MNQQYVVTRDDKGESLMTTIKTAQNVHVEHVALEPVQVAEPELPPTVKISITVQRIRLRWAYGSGLVQPRLPAGSVLCVDEHIAEHINRDSPGCCEVIDPLVEERFELMQRQTGMTEDRMAYSEYVTWQPGAAVARPAEL